jgi:hypothetical protein
LVGLGKLSKKISLDKVETGYILVYSTLLNIESKIMIETEEFCDEEKSYHEWVAQNLDFVNQNKNHIAVMKEMYMKGFAAGFMYKKTLQAQKYGS